MSPDPEDAGPGTDSLKNTLVDRDGYRIRVDVGERKVETSVDVENQKPGYAMITTYMTADAVFTNLTPGHKAVAGNVWVLPAWKSKSVMCDDDVRKVAEPSYYVYSISGKNVWHNAPTTFCAVDGLLVAAGKGVRLDPDESKRVSLEQDTESIEFAVTEQKLTEIEEALRNPDFWILDRSITGEQASAEGVCRDQGRTRGVVAVTQEGKGFCAKIKTDE